jgi:hypothetical protein
LIFESDFLEENLVVEEQQREHAFLYLFHRALENALHKAEKKASMVYVIEMILWHRIITSCTNIDRFFCSRAST